MLCFGGNVFAAGGSGTVADPYIISTPAELQNMQNDLDAHYKLSGDIDMTNIYFEPIGDNVNGAFTGSFDGNGRTIANLQIYGESKYAGLFGYLDGTVKNLTLNNATILGIRYVGGVAGYMDTLGVIDGVSVTGSITAEYNSFTLHVGGIAGYAAGGISNCTNRASFSVETSLSRTEYNGGIVGYAVEGNISGCVNHSNVNSEYLSHAGGIAGYVGSVDVEKCDNYGSISSSSTSCFAGGIIGKIGGNTNNVIDCKNTGSISSFSSSDDGYSYSRYTHSGGIIGGIFSNDNYIEDSINIANISTNSIAYPRSSAYAYSSGIVGFIKGNNNSVLKCYSYGNNTSYASGHSASEYYASGIVGCLSGINNKVLSSVNTGDTSAKYSAGIVGYMSGSNTVNSCINSGEISGRTSYVTPGGIVGSSVGIAVDCINYGIVNSYGNAYGIAQHSTNSISLGNMNASDSIYPTNTSNESNYYLISTNQRSGVGNALSAEQFKSSVNLPTLDLVNVWELDPNKNGGYPSLRNLPETVEINTPIIILNVGEAQRLTASYKGSAVVGSWSSNDGAIAGVSGNGTVTGIKPGYTSVSFKTADGMRANTMVVVRQPLGDIRFELAEQTTRIGSTLGIQPLNYYANDISYRSNDINIATVDEYSGVITGKSLGNTTITATDLITGDTASYSLTVLNSRITSISIDNYDYDNMYVGTQYTIKPSISPSVYDDTITFTSSNPDVLSIDNNGVCTPLRAGTSTVTVRTGANGRTDTETITVRAALKLSADRLFITIDGTAQLTAAIFPEGSTETITYSSSNGEVVSVDADTGLLTGHKLGSATITARSASGLTDSCVVTVESEIVPVTSVTLNPESMILNLTENKTISATILPTTATNKILSWNSSDENVATVDEVGRVTAVGEGVATVTATATSGVYDEVVVSVVSASGAAVVLFATPADVGEVSEVTVKFLRNPGFSAYDLAFDIDESKAEILSAESSLSVGSFNDNLDDADRQALQVGWYHHENVNGDVDLFKLRLRIKDGVPLGEVINISVGNNINGMHNADNEIIPVYFAEVPLNISAVTVGDVYEDGNVNSGDASLLARHLTEIITLNERQMKAADVNPDGVVNMPDIVALAQQIVTTPSVSFSVENLLTEGNIEGISPIITVEKGAINGDRVTYNVSITNNPGIAGLKLAFSYNPINTEVISVTRSESLPGTLTENISHDRVVATWYDSENSTADGLLFSIETRAKGGNTAVITIINANTELCNAELEPVYAVDPGVTINGEVDEDNVTVRLYDSTDTERQSIIAEQTTDGAFVLNNIAEGSYYLTASKPGHLELVITGITVTENPIDLTMHDDKTVSSITLIPGDVDGDGRIDVDDLRLIMSTENYNSTSNSATDINEDGTTDFSDLAMARNRNSYGKTTETIDYNL